MAFLAAAAPYLALAGTAFSGYQSIQQGKAAKAQANQLAAQRDLDAAEQLQQAKAAEAESQREAIDVKKKSKLLASRAMAVAAASGAGTDNVTVENLIGDINAEGEYQKLAALYSGDTDARLARYASASSLRGARTARSEGSATRAAGYANAGSTVLTGASDWYSRYKPPAVK
jgi:hypothetical protein